jgi:translation initiation factor 5A
MALKLINANDAKVGVTILLDGNPCVVKLNDVSKTGKHGHAKCRIEAVGILDGKKRVLVIPSHERMEVPLIVKKRAQVLSINGNNANVMDLENFESFDINISQELLGVINPEDQVEYWVIDEGEKLLKRKF